MSTVLEMKNITKKFPGVLANDNVCFSADSGEVHALLGENGAGKTTLMNILYGLYQPTSGEIYLKGRKVEITSPKVAIENGIGMVHQHFMLIPALSVVENVILGMRQRRGAFLAIDEAAAKVKDLSARYGLAVDPHRKVGDLSVGERQRVEIVKALYRGADLLILDEPTAVLTPQETDELFGVIRHLTAQGHTVIFISHKLNEVKAISDRVTVLRQGRAVTTVKTSRVSKEELARFMVGKEVLFDIEREPLEPGAPVLRLDQIEADNDLGLRALKNVSLEIRQREVLGIAGVDGNGQRELVEVICGLRKASRGTVWLGDIDVTNASPRRITELGTAHIPEDRQARGLVLTMTLKENLVLHDYYRPPFSRGHFLNWKEIRDHSRRLIREFDVRTPHEDLLAKNLSGGNQQKLILARELSSQPQLLVAMHPTRGLDVGAIEYVHRKIMEQRARGAAVLLVSTDLDEILSLSDRIAVIYEGEIMGILANHQVDIGEIGLMMAGVKKTAVA
ncbi:MAG TPA: ABC transporter ATP-binding protein [Clostridia bacterium]|nr:ABC transporter ATP-binding protein [Clostridia bacterium]